MTDASRGEDPERLRTPPSERFAGERHEFDLSASLRELRSEEHPARDGHRQVTIFHRAPVATVLFSFEAGGSLPEHSAQGLVTIHVLEGRLRVHAKGRAHELEAGQLLILNPGVRHDVHAPERAAMLLTVHMEGKG